MKTFNALLMIFMASLIFAQPHSTKRNNVSGRRFEDLEKIKHYCDLEIKKMKDAKKTKK